MDIQPNVALSSKLRLTRMQTHADSHGDTLLPSMGEEGTLNSNRRRDAIGGARKGDEEGITLRVDLIAMKLLECRA